MNTSTGFTTRAADTQHWAGKALSLSNERSPKRALGAALKRDRSIDVAASADHGTQIDSETGTGSYAFNQKWLDRRGLTANSLSVISVRGDSMEPDLYQDDLVLLDHAQTDPKDSHIYVMRFSDGLYVKRIQHLPEGQVHLISRNLAYPPITIKSPETAGVTIIGRVVASMHEW